MKLSSFRDLLETLGIRKSFKPLRKNVVMVSEKKEPPKGWTIHCEPDKNLEVFRK